MSSEDGGLETSLEKRGSRRNPTTAVVTVKLKESEARGAGRNVSKTGAYLVTSDPLGVEIEWHETDGEGNKVVSGRIVRIDRLTQDSIGIAVEFDSPQRD